MLSLLASVDDTLRTFFNQLTEALGFNGYLGLVLGVEALFIILFVIKSAFSYEARLKRSLDKANKWLFKNKKIDVKNIKDFTNILKKGPKRLIYFWQQYILYREGEPSLYLSEDNLIGKPLKTSSWASNIRNLGIITGVWAVVSLILGLASQMTQTFGFQAIATGLVLPALVAILGVIAIIGLKARRVANLDDTYHIYHIFIRFLTNACVDLTPYLDFNLLFTEKELANGNPQLREYYEARARKIKEEFENAQKNDVPLETYQFENVGVDGALLLNRAMKESETYISKKNQTLSQIAQIEAQKDALKRNYENVQMDLQRKIQASKENIDKLIEQQASTTSRIEVGLLRQQQEKEVNKRASLQKDYDQEEKRYLLSKNELDKEIEELKKDLDAGLEDVQKGMTAEYQTFFEKVMKSAYQVAEAKVKDEKSSLVSERDKNENELVSVQTQIKRLKDENDTLRNRLSQYDANYMNESQPTDQGYYDEQGNYIYSDGSYHDTNGLFHDVDGKVYNMNGELVSQDYSPEEQEQLKREAIKNDQIESFGAYIDDNNEVSPAAPVEEPEGEEQPDAESETDAAEESEEAPAEEVAETPAEEVETEEPQESEESQVLEEPQPEPEIEEPAEEPKEEMVEEPEEQPKQEEKVESKEETAPAKKRGRPRKTVSADEPTTTEPKKRGRPRKTQTEETVSTTAKKRGRPAKTTSKAVSTAKSKTTSTAKKPASAKKKTTTSSAAKKSTAKPKTTAKTTSTSQTAKRGRPRKTTTATEQVATEPKKRGRPRKQTPEISGSFLDKINELINQEENRLKSMKAYFNSEIDQALEPEEQDNINHEKDDIMSAVEALKAQADQAKSNGQSEELSKINKRIEDLIKELSNINSGEEGGEGANSNTAR